MARKPLVQPRQGVDVLEPLVPPRRGIPLVIPCGINSDEKVHEQNNVLRATCDVLHVRRA
jgi:hypothetical protein